MKAPWISLKEPLVLSTVYWCDECDDFDTDMFECDVEYHIETIRDSSCYYMRFNLDIEYYEYNEYYAECFSGTYRCQCGSEHFFKFEQPGVSVMYGPRHLILIVSHSKCKEIDKVKNAIECLSKVSSEASSRLGISTKE